MSVNEMLMAAAGASGAANEFVEDCFATHLYTGTGSSQTITNNIDLSGKGGMLWIKARSGATDNFIVDTVRGRTEWISSNTSNPVDTYGLAISSFNSNGFTLGTDSGGPIANGSGTTYASWTFREAPKFFDVVTYTGNGATNRQISHSLGAAPGMVIAKCTNTSSDWFVWHRSLTGTNYNAYLNDATAAGAYTDFSSDGSGTMSSSSFCVNGSSNINGNTYIAYLFAHNAGGFGASGSDNIISCGSYNGNGGTQSINVGFEPQFLLVKRSNGTTSPWFIYDTMRNFANSGGDSSVLQPHLNAIEGSSGKIFPTATGFGFSSESVSSLNATGGTYIYMAIRRPMKTPTTGTQVFSSISRTGTSNSVTLTNIGFPLDLIISKTRNDTIDWGVRDRLRGASRLLRTNLTSAEISDTAGITSLASMNGLTLGADGSWSTINASFATYINYAFKRAPGFFDIVCYTGTSGATTVPHNLGVVPEMIIVKRRSSASSWFVYHSGMGNTKSMYLESTVEEQTDVDWNNTTPTASVFSVGNSTNNLNATHVAYLFATLAGVSKVGSYIGNDGSQTINCGFSGGARFVLIKRATGNEGSWILFDTIRGITSGNDPFLEINSLANESTGTDPIDPTSSGFVVNQLGSSNINVSGSKYIYLAIA